MLRAQLEPVARRQRNLLLVLRLACWWVAMTVMGLGFLRWSQASNHAWLIPLVIVAFAGAAAIWTQTRGWQPNWLEIARRVEEQHPQLHALLRTAVEQHVDAVTGQFNFLQQRVIAQAGAEARRYPLINSVSTTRLALAHGFHAGAFIVLIWMVLSIPAGVTFVAPVAPAGDSITVTPGNVTIERGHGLAILARFEGFVPAEVNLVMNSAGESSRRIPLAKSLDDPVFGGSISEVTADMTYHVEYGDQRTTNYLVQVFDYPKLERADALITPPTYTGQEPKRIEDTRRISAVEGSKLDLSFQLNKPVASARLLAKDNSVVTLAVSPDKPSLAWDGVILQTNQTYELQLVDLEGRTNKISASLIVNVLKNRPPELKMGFPRGDQKVSPLEELGFEVQVSDDYGLTQAGLTYTLAGKEPKTITLSTKAGANEKQTLRHLLRMEELGLQPDDLVNYYIWADDIGPDGQVRRTSGDMFFAEIRPFDEIFREGQSGSAGGGQAAASQQGKEAARLGELQKEIINATWKLRRREAGNTTPSAPYSKDATVIRDAQKDALEQVESAKEQARAGRSRQLLETVEQRMKEAVKHLDNAVGTPGSLPEALTAEQAAYQALLKLQAHEYQVTQSQQNQSQQGGGQRNQQQLNQLDLKQAENRYETERQATQQQQNTERQEQVQVISRLKELAQRQQDVKERLQELQTALQQAETEQEKEEIRRRLKRLREEEQQMLADIDELRERMSKPENQSRMAESREQLEQIRSQVQRAAESLESENVSQALTSATRAERELEELRDDFRKAHSSQFTEQMRQMRSDARSLGEKQDEIGQKLQDMAQEKRKTLTDEGQTQELLQTLQQQQEAVTNLVKQMTQVTQEAENIEPLLARQLYETVRKASQGNLEDSLKLTSELVKRRFVEEARPFESRAQQEVQQLKRGVEQAAQNILGDDTEALRMARQEVDRLAEAVQREMAQATGGQGSDSSSTNNASAPGSTDTNRLGQATAQGATQNAANGRDGKSTQSANETGQGQGGQPGQSSATSPEQTNGTPNSPGQGEKSGSPGEGPANGQQRGQAAGQGNGRQPGQGAGETNGPPSSAQGAGQPSGEGGARQGKAGPGRNRTQGQRFFDSPQQREGGGGGGGSGPLTGPEYTQWSDRIRNVEEMLDESALRAEVATIRERVRAMRSEFKRHAQVPQWDLVQTQIVAPLTELRSRISEELARRESNEALVPIDRDPVPQKFSDLVRRYYEKLGQ